jgi:hypothetical protein
MTRTCRGLGRPLGILRAAEGGKTSGMMIGILVVGEPVLFSGQPYSSHAACGVNGASFNYSRDYRNAFVCAKPVQGRY